MLIGLVAIVLGVISLVTKSGGKGMAIAGVSTGSAGVVIGLIMLIVALNILSGSGTVYSY